MNKKSRKPVIFPGKTVSRADDFRGAQDARAKGEHSGDFNVSLDAVPEDADSSYVPGYSELRKRQDTQRASGKAPEPLPARLQWARAYKVDGSPDHARVNIQWKKQGYRPATLGDLMAFGWGSPPAAAYSNPEKGGDGFFYREDSMLLICDGDRARRNYERLREKTQTMSEGGSGGEPWVKKETEQERIIRLTDADQVFGRPN